MERIVRTTAMAVAVMSAVIMGISPTSAQQEKSAGKKAQPTAASTGPDAEAVLDRARRALDEGKMDVAQQLAGTVLMSEKKDVRSTARALGIRGESYLRQGRPAEAMADLDSALWLKGGLSGRDRELATTARSKAMQQGGLAKDAPVLTTPQPAPLPPPAPARSVQAPSAPVLQAPPPPQAPVAWNSAVTAAAPSPPPPQVMAAPAPPPPPPAARQEISPPPPVLANPVRSARSEPETKPPAQTPELASRREATSSGGGGLGGFFSNLFGGGSGNSGSKETSTDNVTTGALSPPRARPPETSSFTAQRVESEARQVRMNSPPVKSPSPAPPAARPAAPVQSAAMVVPTSPRPASPPMEGAYRLQLSAMKTKEEAEAMAKQVRSQQAGLVGAYNFEVVEDVYGNMGRFYRVRIGPFTEPTQALSVCASLREQRMDCMVLDR